MNSITGIFAADLARQQMTSSAQAARVYAQRRPAEQPRTTPRRRPVWRIRWHHPARAGLVG